MRNLNHPEDEFDKETFISYDSANADLLRRKLTPKVIPQVCRRE